MFNGCPPLSQFYQIDVTDLAGQRVPLQQFAGQVCLVVNTASLCGFTPQYAALEQLYQRYQAQGFQVLAFPCNQFGQQEPGSSEQIQQFCQRQFAVSFPVFARLEVKGPTAHPLYQYLTQARPGLFGTQAIKWNFTKFLINRTGEVVDRFAPQTRPERLEPRLRQLLGLTETS